MGQINVGYLIICVSLSILWGSTNGDDSAAMLQLAKVISPLPAGWSASTGSGYCSWKGVNCNGDSVTSITLSNKKLSGTLPKELGTLGSLKTLSLQGNTFSGPVPSLSKISSLSEIYLDSNNFTAFPDGFFVGLTGLSVFSINQNPSLAPWPIPSALTEATGLTRFLASSANLIGSIPDVFGSFPSLTDLKLSYNNLTGSLPASFGGTQIKNLWMNNQMTGLSGSIDVLASMSSLMQVWLQKNSFTGTIPDLSKCTDLFDLQLRDNAFTGVVPDGLINLSSLRNVSLSNNKFQGRRPKFQFSNVDDNGVNHYCLNTPGTPCDPQVTALVDVASAFENPAQLAEGWEGNDACAGWVYVACDAGKSVTVVNLGKHYFGGQISPSIGNLTSLKRLYLNDNNLTGTIPGTLATLANLQFVDVSNNNLSGKIPPFGDAVKFVYTGNPFIGTNVDTTAGTGSNKSPSFDGTGSTAGGKGGISGGVVAGIAVVALVCAAIVAGVVYMRCIRRKAKSQDSTGGACCANGYGAISDARSQGSSGRNILEGGNVVISIEVLRQVTDNFNERNILGQGGFGVVYKGELHDGTKIAVKRMEGNQMGNKGISEFQAEIDVLTKVRHRHLVALLGYCINGGEKLLVYEYMPQGTLAQHLFERRDLTWKQRVAIALDVARGVEYLHSLAQQSFIHRDLKPSNILLGDDMRAKVADFGLVKLAPDGKYSLETRLAGTFGYLAPEYATTGRVTVKVDVYAFGVILMEIITGRMALDDTLPDERAHLVAWFRRVLIAKEDIAKTVDSVVELDEETLESVLKVAELAGHCTAREPHQRPLMGHAVNVLGPLVEQWRPTSQEEEEEGSGVNLQMSLPECVQRWRANEGITSLFDSSGSIPEGVTSTFKSSDCR